MQNLHPLIGDDVILPTFEIDRLVLAIRKLLKSRAVGGCIFGNQRTGKSEARKFLYKYGEQVLEANIPAAMINAWRTTAKNDTELRLYSYILSSLGHYAAKRNSAYDREVRLLGMIVDKVRKAGEYRFILYIDEAQWLSDYQFSILVNLHNQLKDRKVRLVVLLFGQPELETRKAELLEAKKIQNISRFMRKEYRFQGMSDPSHLKYLYHYFDKMQWPQNSGVSYTGHFLPRAYSNAWRLEEHAEFIWRCISKAMIKYNIPAITELPMEPIMALTVEILMESSEQDSEEFKLKEEFVIDKIHDVAAEAIYDHIWTFSVSSSPEAA